MAPSGRRKHHAAATSESERRSGPSDRRSDTGAAAGAPKADGNVTFDDKGNAVWEWRIDEPRRREDDPTVDFLECLDIDDLEIEGDDSEDDEPQEGFNPYSHS